MMLYSAIDLLGRSLVISCFRFEHTEPHRNELHRHDEGQFFILLNGAAAFITAEGERVMTAGRPCWVPPNLDHGVSSRGGIAGINVFVPVEVCANLPAKICILKGNGFIDYVANRMLELRANASRLENLWTVLADELCAAEQDDFYLPAPQDGRLRLLADTLARNPADCRGLEAWAEDINMAQRTLVRKFRRETGMSFVEWRQRARILLAIKLLGEGESVTQVALTVGYDSLSAFIAVFRQLTGVAPSQYLRATVSGSTRKN